MRTPKAEVHECSCFCPFCLSFEGNTVPLNLADWETMRAVVNGLARNLSGDELDVTREAGWVTVTLASERGGTARQIWRWRADREE